MPLNVCGQANESYNFELSCVRPGLASGGLKISFLWKSEVRIGHPYFFKNYFYEENKNAFVNSNIIFLLQ